jgi:hypothetical protein
MLSVASITSPIETNRSHGRCSGGGVRTATSRPWLVISMVSPCSTRCSSSLARCLKAPTPTVLIVLNLAQSWLIMRPAVWSSLMTRQTGAYAPAKLKARWHTLCWQRTMRVLVFDVIETLLDLEAMDPAFESVFGDRAVRRRSSHPGRCWRGHRRRHCSGGPHQPTETRCGGRPLSGEYSR